MKCALPLFAVLLIPPAAAAQGDAPPLAPLQTPAKEILLYPGEHGFVNKGGGADHFMDRLQEWLAANILLSEAEAGVATPP